LSMFFYSNHFNVFENMILKPQISMGISALAYGYTCDTNSCSELFNP
jgi:hypothetical protein